MNEIKIENSIMKVHWLCEVRGLLESVKLGPWSAAGTARLAYFDDFLVLIYRSKSGELKIYPKPISINIKGGVYGAMKLAAI